MLFKDVKIGEKFYFNGNECQKVSSRTAKILDYGMVFYFSQKDVVKLAKV